MCAGGRLFYIDSTTVLKSEGLCDLFRYKRNVNASLMVGPTTEVPGAAVGSAVTPFICHHQTNAVAPQRWPFPS